MTGQTRGRWLGCVLLLLAAAAPFAGILVRGEVPTFRDHESYFLPLRWHTAETIRGGDLPLWNPWNGGGEPWLANPQTGVFYPPAWLIALLPFSRAYVLFLIFHLALLGWGSWTLFRRWTGDSPALVASLALMLSGPVFSLVDINNNLASFAWLPLVLRLAAERRERRSVRSLLLLSFALALTFLGGEPLFAALAALATLAILLPRDWLGAVFAGATAAGVSAVQLLPFLEWIAGSERAAGLAPSDAFQHAVRPGDWLALAIPMAGAGPGLEPLRMGQSFIPSLYIGVPIVILALTAGVGSARTERPERQRVLAFLLLSFAAVVLLTAAPMLPGGSEFLLAFGANAIRYPARLIPLAALVVAGLAAIGLERARREPLGARVGITLSVALLGGLHFLTVEPMAEQTTLVRFVLFLGWIAVFGLVFVAFPRWLTRPSGQLVLGIALVAELLFAAQPFLDSRALVTRIEPWESALAQPWSVVRVQEEGVELGQEPRAWLAGYLNLYGRQLDASTASPVVDRSALAMQEAVVDGGRPDLIDAAGARWVLSSRPSLGDGYLPTDVRRGSVRLFENIGALPPVQLWEGGRVAGSRREALETVLSSEFDATREIVLSGSGATALGRTGNTRRFDDISARLALGPSSARIRYEVSSGGVLVLNQRWTRGWSVRVNGLPSEPIVANGLFRGVEVPRGRGVVVWTYRPATLWIGALLSALFVIAITTVLIFVRR
jgi:hypothetical protein